jgi:3-oxoacyl-[acyl-carrier protein] reductase
VNLEGVFACTQAALPAMQQAGWGRIVNLSSEAGRMGAKADAVYAATKGAVIAFTKSIAMENARYGITVNAVAPGPIETPLVMSLSEDWRKRKASELPLGRFGQPEEVASVVAFLVSPGGSLFVGQTLGPNSGDVML